MNASEPADDALDALLHGVAPEPLADDGFVARTMAAVDIATRSMPAPRRATPIAPIAIARALIVERRRYEAQARLRRWVIMGVVAGFVLFAVAVLLAPDGTTIAPPSSTDWLVLSVLAAVGTLWASWRELRD